MRIFIINLQKSSHQFFNTPPHLDHFRLFPVEFACWTQCFHEHKLVEKIHFRGSRGRTVHQDAEKVRQESEFKKNFVNRLSSPSASKRVPYHVVLGVWSMADWLTCSAFTHRARVHSRAQKSFFILLSKFIKFLHINIFMGNTMALIFFHKTFGKI